MRLLVYSMFLCLVISCGYTYAQQDNEYKLSLKNYMKIVPSDVPNKSVSLRFIAPGFNIMDRKGNFHEIELSEINHSNSLEINGITATNNVRDLTRYYHKESRFSMNYSFNKKIAAYNQLQFFVGPSIGLSYALDKETASDKPDFYNRERNRGIYLNIIPRMQWNITDRWYLDVNIPIRAYGLNYTEEGTQSYDNIEFKNQIFPNKNTVNVGIGLRF